MVQLKVYDGATQYWLDLYETEPIKLNLSIEDITDTQARSVFSRTFRVPGTGNNNLFFKHAFLIDGIDYDVTVKKRAEILVDGAEFKQGHVRLQKIYTNTKTDGIDYEIIFLGETRDFSSVIGSKSLRDLDMSAYSHTLSYNNINASWQAYPQGNATAGLFNGDILYPLIDFGNVYDSSGPFPIATEARIAFTAGGGQATGLGFNHQAINADRFKPMVRAKYLMDKIFQEAGYEFQSTFMDSELFRKVYVSAFGNTADYKVQNTENQNTFKAVSSTTQVIQYGVYAPLQDTVEFTNVIFDNNNNYDGSRWYTAPITGGYNLNAEITGINTVLGGVKVYLIEENGSAVPGTTSVFTSSDITYVYNGNVGLTAGQKYGFIIEAVSSNIGGNNKIFAGSQYGFSVAPGLFDVSELFDVDYKQVDFVKDVLTTFRMVMAPDATNTKRFIIEPWNDYIASGDVYDWSSRLDENTDVQIEPLFFSQTETVNFNTTADEDYENKFNFDLYKQNFGNLIFEANNELLTGSRDINLGWASTPLTQIEGAGVNANMIIPQIHTHTAEKEFTLHLAVKPKTRFLFYNGLETIAGAYEGIGVGQAPFWLFFNEATNADVTKYAYPRATFWSDTIPTNNTINLNWQIERGYYAAYTGFNGLLGRALYDVYWADYINSLYNKYARRVTCNVILDNVDLQSFSFDDVVFINGVYYRPEKIIDAEIGNLTPVKVELIKLLEYIPSGV